MHTSFVVTHKRDGVFVGIAFGLVFWSNLDTVGQDTVPVCETYLSASALLAHLASVDPDADETCSQYEIKEVLTTAKDSATVTELRAAGLDVSGFDRDTLEHFNERRSPAN
jgi:hypothetical protein